MKGKLPRHVEAVDIFVAALKRLKKRYPHVDAEVKPLIDALAKGETPGDQVQGTGYSVYKVRLPNPDAQRGKSGGFRIIYYLKTLETILLIYIYSKTDRADLDADEIRRMIDESPSDR